MERLASYENSFDENQRRIAFLDLLLKEHKTDPAGFTLKDIREEVDTFMFAGHDTTTFATFWACHAISQHPEVQKKLHNEIDTVLSKSFLLDLVKVSHIHPHA
jgi:cytochrome P450